jgi:hypothetical protein
MDNHQLRAERDTLVRQGCRISVHDVQINPNISRPPSLISGYRLDRREPPVSQVNMETRGKPQSLHR